MKIVSIQHTQTLQSYTMSTRVHFGVVCEWKKVGKTCLTVAHQHQKKFDIEMMTLMWPFLKEGKNGERQKLV